MEGDSGNWLDSVFKITQDVLDTAKGFDAMWGEKPAPAPAPIPVAVGAKSGGNGLVIVAVVIVAFLLLSR